MECSIGTYLIFLALKAVVTLHLIPTIFNVASQQSINQSLATIVLQRDRASNRWRIGKWDKDFANIFRFKAIWRRVQSIKLGRFYSKKYRRYLSNTLAFYSFVHPSRVGGRFMIHFYLTKFYHCYLIFIVFNFVITWSNRKSFKLKNIYFISLLIQYLVGSDAVSIEKRG